MKNKIITLGLFTAVIAFASVSKCQAQKQGTKKVSYDTTALEKSTFDKLQALEEQFKNLSDPKWIDQQKGIIKMQYETILQTVAETKKLDQSQMRYENGKLITQRKPKE